MAYEIIGHKKKKIPNFVTSAKTLKGAIARSEKWLKQLVHKYGIYENFGEGVSRVLNDKYINISSYSDKMNANRHMLDNFNQWRYRYNGN